jgi:DNA repair protein RecN (Recombination protein N)
MLKRLFIQNIILIEKASLHFTEGLNILTGETGSGKSAIMQSLNLVFGERADATIIRRGCDKGYVEAAFEVTSPHIRGFLTEGGIDHDAEQELIIRRELSESGKNRIFINSQQTQLTFLRRLGQLLTQTVGQHANQQLLSSDTHRSLLDLYGSLQPLLQRFQQRFDLENQLKGELDLLIREEGERIRTIENYQRQLEELEEAQLKEDEEEELFAEFTLLQHAEEMACKIDEINECLSGDRQPVIPLLNRQRQTLESLVPFDPSLNESLQILQTACLDLQELAHTLRCYQGHLNSNPCRLEEVNERLTLLNQVKRKYGATISDVIAYRDQTSIKLSQLENRELEIDNLKIKLQDAEGETHEAAHALTLQRKQCAAELAARLTKELHTLNMSKALFFIELSPQKRTRNGDEKVEFFLQPNQGEHKIPLTDGVSGGEISRILLALQTLLGGKEDIATLIFDEVDANIGGETAGIVGEKLKEISQGRQVICITHFPQVASFANHHFCIYKKEIEGRTFTLIDELANPEARQQELARMVGSKTR